MWAAGVSSGNSGSGSKSSFIARCQGPRLTQTLQTRVPPWSEARPAWLGGRFACRPCRPRDRRNARPKNQSDFQGKVPYRFSRETVVKPFSLGEKNS
jgi:hypothetical protein